MCLRLTFDDYVCFLLLLLSLFFFFFFFSSFFFLCLALVARDVLLWGRGDVNSLFCLAHGCTNSCFITAELQIPRTREHVFLGSV